VAAADGEIAGNEVTHVFQCCVFFWRDKERPQVAAPRRVNMQPESMSIAPFDLFAQRLDVVNRVDRAFFGDTGNADDSERQHAVRPRLCDLAAEVFNVDSEHGIDIDQDHVAAADAEQIGDLAEAVVSRSGYKYRRRELAVAGSGAVVWDAELAFRQQFVGSPASGCAIEIKVIANGVGESAIKIERLIGLDAETRPRRESANRRRNAFR
jgi:hypothetical protein